jgi:hypothetical protein
MPADPSSRPTPEELRALLLHEVQALRGCLSRLEQAGRERLRAEEARRHEERRRHERDKLEAVARLADGVARHFNDLLTAVLAHSALLLSDLPSDGPSRGECPGDQGGGGAGGRPGPPTPDL